MGFLFVWGGGGFGEGFFVAFGVCLLLLHNERTLLPRICLET